MSDLSMDEFFDGWALWQEHRPQSGEDWVAVAERCLSMPPRPDNPSPVFAGVLLAVEQRDSLADAIEEYLLCQPGKFGYATGHKALVDALRKVRPA